MDACQDQRNCSDRLALRLNEVSIVTQALQDMNRTGETRRDLAGMILPK
jgi:hypothetical protein